MKGRKFNRVVDGACYGAGFFLFNTAISIVISIIMGMFVGCNARRAEAEALPKYMIAVIDSGYDPARATVPAKLCHSGHYDYFTNSPNPNFTDSHGTEVTNLIAEKLVGVDYCVLVYQVFIGPNDFKIDDLTDALARARAAGANVINMSIGGVALWSRGLEDQLEKNSEMKIATFCAAGNQGVNLDKNCQIYPACYKKPYMFVIGAQDPMEPRKPAADSNYGKKSVDAWAPGWYDDGKSEGFGTSYASPRALAEFVLFLERKRLAAEKPH